MTDSRFLTICESKTGLFFLSILLVQILILPILLLPNLLFGRQFTGNFLNKFACLPLSDHLMANMRVYFF